MRDTHSGHQSQRPNLPVSKVVVESKGTYVELDYRRRGLDGIRVVADGHNDYEYWG